MVVSQILINKPIEGVHKPGKCVTGLVKYIVDEPTPYKEVSLSFLGAGVCDWSENTGKVTIHYHGSEVYVIHVINLTNKEPEQTITLHGEYQHPFEFYLPEDIPTSYADYVGSITYTIQLKFVKPDFFSFNKVFTTVIPVYSPVSTKTAAGTVVNNGPVIFGLERSLFSPFAIKKPVVNVKGEIAKVCVMPGEKVHLSYVVTNNTNVAITSLNTELYSYITYTADSGTTKKQQVKVKGCEVATSEVIGAEVRHFTCILPTLPKLRSIQGSKVISQEYIVRATLRLPMPYRNASVEMPIVIGELKGSMEPQMGIEAFGEGEQPPSYWQAMHEEKEQKKSAESK